MKTIPRDSFTDRDPFAMPREAEPSLSERTFVSKALEEGLRLDNRKFDQCRPVVLTFGDEYGVADVKFGKTRCASLTLQWISIC